MYLSALHNEFYVKMAYEYWPVEYAADALGVLYQKENKLPRFLYQSPQLSARPTLVKWILQLCEQFKFGNGTAHLAVYILDRFMDGHSIVAERLKLIVLACLRLSAKFEERDVSVPKIAELNSVVNNQYLRSDFIKYESLVLKYLDWYLSLPTAFKFLEYYSLVATSQSELNVLKCSSYEEFWYDIQEAIKEYMNLSLEDPKMLQFKPSEVACSCIILARRRIGVKPLWTKRLIEITHYKFSELTCCANDLLRFSVNYVKRKLTESPDQGYVTEDSKTRPPLKKIAVGRKKI